MIYYMYVYVYVVFKLKNINLFRYMVILKVLIIGLFVSEIFLLNLIKWFFLGFDVVYLD